MMSWRSSMMRSVALMALLTMMSGLTACVSGGSASKANFALICKSDLAAPIEYSATDDPLTIAAVNRHNGAYACACEKDCPP